jgi:hypothetical protein
MDIIIKPNDKEYIFLSKNKDMIVEIQKGNDILNGIIKSISSNGTYIVEIMEKK